MASNEEDDEDLFDLDAPSCSTMVDFSKVDVVAEIDSILNECSGEANEATSATTLVCSKIDEAANSLNPKDHEKNNNFLPQNQSTPIRPSPSKVPATWSKTLASIAEEPQDHEDYSLLDSDEDDGIQTIPLDMHFNDLDMSLLEDDDEAEKVDDTVIEVKPKVEVQAEASEGHLAPVAQPKTQLQPKTEEKNLVVPNGKSADVTRNVSISRIMKEYYSAAMRNWTKTTAPGYPLPTGPFDIRLSKPNVTRDRNGDVLYLEGVDEWADKNHPMWEEYRRETSDESKIGGFIHRKWNWNSSIDITRNLTKFSAPRARQVKVEAAVKKKGRVALKAEAAPCAIKNQDLLRTVLQNIQNEKEEEWDPLEGPSKQENEVDCIPNALANCRYCAVVCHCSPGRRLKRPYIMVAGAASRADSPELGVRHEKLLRLDQVHCEVRQALNTQMQSEIDLKQPNAHQEVTYYRESAINVISSTSEAFELAVNYRSCKEDPPSFSRDQVRELLSVELTQDKYRSIYMSPYAGQGMSDVEDDAVDSHDELGSIGGESDDESVNSGPSAWTASQVENY